jgi:hypothetical protein
LKGQENSSLPVEQVCPICNKPEDSRNDPDNVFVMTIMPTSSVPERLHNNCRKKLGLAIWQR